MEREEKGGNVESAINLCDSQQRISMGMLSPIVFPRPKNGRLASAILILNSTTTILKVGHCPAVTSRANQLGFNLIEQAA